MQFIMIRGGDMTNKEIEEMAGHRQVPPWVMMLVQNCIEKERELCARVCENRANGYQHETDVYAHEHISEANYCAAAIRARGNDEPR